MDTEIMLVATVGEMGSFYNQADIVCTEIHSILKELKLQKSIEAIQRNVLLSMGLRCWSLLRRNKLGISELFSTRRTFLRPIKMSLKEREIKIKEVWIFLKEQEIISNSQ